MRDKRLQQVHTTLAFLRSVIMSGEPMTNEVRNAIDDSIYNIKNVEESLDKQLNLHIVSQRSELLKALIGKEENATLLNGKKCRVLKSVEESYLIQENHNDKIRWVGISEIDAKSL